MQLAYLVVGLVVGLLLVAVSALCAVLYTPYTKSTFDTVVTAFTGSSLQVGNLLVVSASTALVFEALAAFADVELSVLVPVLVGYAAVHLVAHWATQRVGDLMEQPLDPDFSLDSVSFGPLDGPRTALGARRGDGNGGN